MEKDFVNQIKEEVTTYCQTLGDVGKWRVIGIISRLLGLFLLMLTVLIFALGFFVFGAIAAVDALLLVMPLWAASAIICGVFLILIMVALLARRPLFINPFIKMLSKEIIKTEEELEKKQLEADHKLEMQNVRIETQVQQVKQEANFYINLAQHVWGWVTKLFA